MEYSKNIELAKYYDQMSDGPRAALHYVKAMYENEPFDNNDLFNAAVIFILLDDVSYDKQGIVPEDMKSQCYDIANEFLDMVKHEKSSDSLDVEFWKSYIDLLTGVVEKISIPEEYFPSGAISAAVYLENGTPNKNADINKILSKATEMNSERGRYIFSVLEKYKAK